MRIRITVRHLRQFQDYSYKILNSVDPSLGGTLCNTTPYDTCYDACGTTPPASPTPSITPSITPTPTPTPSVVYELYSADRYDCSGVGNTCVFIETLDIANPSVLNTGKFYYDSTNDYIFNIVGAPIAGPYLYTSMSGIGTNNCNLLCSV